MILAALEATGLLMVVAFTYLVWPPLALLSGGLFLVLAANMLHGRNQSDGDKGNR